MERIQTIRRLIYFMRAVVTNVHDALAAGVHPAAVAATCADQIRDVLREEREAVTAALDPLDLNLLGAIVELLEARGLNPDDIISALDNAITAWSEQIDRLLHDAAVAGPPGGPAGNNPNAPAAPGNPPGPRTPAHDPQWQAAAPQPPPGENVGQPLDGQMDPVVPQPPQQPIQGVVDAAAPNPRAQGTAYNPANPAAGFGVQGGGWTPQGVKKKKKQRQKHKKTHKKRKRRRRRKKKTRRRRRRHKKVRITRRRRKRGGFYKKITRSL